MIETRTKRSKEAISLEILVLNDLHNQGGVSDQIYEKALRELEKEYAESSSLPLH